jgi:hypothetical protein
MGFAAVMLIGMQGEADFLFFQQFYGGRHTGSLLRIILLRRIVEKGGETLFFE